MAKTRFYVTPSSLGAYFGLYQDYGTSPMDQLEIDLGNQEAEFDDAAIDRMSIGKIFESPVLDYFEEKLNIKITERNEDFIYPFDGMMKGIIDGFTNYIGLPTGVEAKYSNSTSGSFVDNLGYHFQCHAYMEAKKVDQWLLLGFYQGKPQFKLIKKNNEMMDDLEEMVVKVFDILNGIQPKETFPWHLVEKYSKTTQAAPFEPSGDDLLLVEEYVELKEELASMKDKEARLKELESYLKDSYEGAYENSNFKITIGSVSKKGSIDIQRLSMDYPDIDFEQYRAPDSTYKSIRFKKAKTAS